MPAGADGCRQGRRQGSCPSPVAISARRQSSITSAAWIWLSGRQGEPRPLRQTAAARASTRRRRTDRPRPIRACGPHAGDEAVVGERPPARAGCPHRLQLAAVGRPPTASAPAAARAARGKRPTGPGSGTRNSRRAISGPLQRGARLMRDGLKWRRKSCFSWRPTAPRAAASRGRSAPTRGRPPARGPAVEREVDHEDRLIKPGCAGDRCRPGPLGNRPQAKSPAQRWGAFRWRRAPPQRRPEGLSGQLGGALIRCGCRPHQGGHDPARRPPAGCLASPVRMWPSRCHGARTRPAMSAWRGITSCHDPARSAATSSWAWASWAGTRFHLFFDIAQLHGRAAWPGTGRHPAPQAGAEYFSTSAVGAGLRADDQLPGLDASP